MTDLAIAQAATQGATEMSAEPSTVTAKDKPKTEAKKKAPAKAKNETPKAANEKQAKAVNRSRRGEPEKLSNPTMVRNVSLSTLQAHRVYLRTMRYVSNSLFNLGVILHIIGDGDTADETEKKARDAISTVSNEIDVALGQCKILFEQYGIENLVEYTHLISAEVSIQAPLTLKFVDLLEKMDELIRYIDTLWMQGEMPSSDRAHNNAAWQRRLTKLANEIIAAERRAHASAVSKGKSAELESANISETTESVSEEDEDEE